MSAPITSSLVSLLAPAGDLPYEMELARRCDELGISYATALCAVRASNLGVQLFLDRASHELVEVSADGEVRYDAGRFEGWATP